MNPVTKRPSVQQLDAGLKEIPDQWPPHVFQAAADGWTIAAALFSRSYRVSACSPRMIMAVHQPL